MKNSSYRDLLTNSDLSDENKSVKKSKNKIKNKSKKEDDFIAGFNHGKKSFMEMFYVIDDGFRQRYKKTHKHKKPKNIETTKKSNNKSNNRLNNKDTQCSHPHPPPNQFLNGSSMIKSNIMEEPFASILNSIIGKNKEDTVHYLEDSDDDDDYQVTMKDLIPDKTVKHEKQDICMLKDIIMKNNISSIDDLIAIGYYYETTVLPFKKDCPKSDNVINNEYSDTLFLDNLFKKLGLNKDTDCIKIIVQDEATNTVMSRSYEPKEETVEKALKPAEVQDNIYNLYKINSVFYTVNLEKVYNIKSSLIKLKKMVGLKNIKNEIIDMILYYLMEFEKSNNNMLHMTLEGSPGCGKTKLAKIISKIISGLGILSNNKVVYARRTDLIGSYLGQTGQKTQKVIDSANGGVLFIDEAYSLGSSEKDIYSKECLDILNQNLSDNKKKFVCIIAGYAEELKNFFFSANPGLVRRFPFKFSIEEYTHDELLKIFINKIYKLDWKLNSDVNIELFFKSNYKDFKYFGGDIETFIQDIKYTHCRRIVCEHPSEFKIINNDDINISFEKFKKRRTDKTDCYRNSLYI